jgi:hypothetical protein
MCHPLRGLALTVPQFIGNTVSETNERGVIEAAACNLVELVQCFHSRPARGVLVDFQACPGE